MRRAARWAAAAMVAAAVFWPRPARAGVIDFIWEMSGPQMMGGPVLVCSFDLEANQHECRMADVRITRGNEDLAFQKTRRWWLSFGAAVFTSTGKPKPASIKFGEVWMVAHEPMLHMKSVSRAKGEFAVEHGLAGLTHFVVVGDKFGRFSNVGLKFTPLAIRYRRFVASYSLRLFPKGFTAQQFGAPGPSAPREAEVVPALSLGVLIR